MAPLSLKVVQDTGAVVTRTVKVDSKDTVEAVLDVVKEKFMIADDGKEYGLFLTAADDELSGVWLQSLRPLEYYMLRDGDELLLLCRTRILRLRTLDGTVKTLQVDESQPISQMLVGICARIGITNHEEYGLCYDEEDTGTGTRPSTGTLTLKRPPQQQGERDAKLEHMSKKLKTDDNVQWLDMHRTLRELRVRARATLLLQRRLYYSDRNVDARDPVQLNLLYVQTRDAILDGRHPVTVEQACEFAGLQCQIQYGDYQEEKRKTGYLDDYKELLPSNISNKSGLDKKIIKEYKKHQGLSSIDAKHLYTKTARALPTYGVTFFVVKEKQQKGKKKLVPRLLGISANAILRLDEETKEILQSWALTQVMSYQVGKSHTFTLNFGDYSDKEYSVKTNDAVRIRDILQGYIDIIAKRLAGARSVTMSDGQVIVEDNIHTARAHIVQHVQNNPSKVVEESFVGPTKILAYEPGQTASQGTQLVTVQQVIISSKMEGQKCTLTGEVLHRKGMSLDFVRKLNRMNSNSVKVVNLISSDGGPHTVELKAIVSTMENDLPLIESGMNEIVKTDMDEDAKKRLLNELQELTEFLNTLTQQINGPNPESDEALEAASKIADVSTQMYLGLDPLTKRRSNLIRISRQSFIEDEKVDASVRLASLLSSAAGAGAAADRAKAVIGQAYEGALSSSEVEDLEKSARDKMCKLNGAVALFLTAHADLENIDYSGAVTSMNAINELILELAKDAQALASTKDGEAKQELIEDIGKLLEATKLVCSLPGSVDRQKLQDVTSMYGSVADKLILTFRRGRRDDKDNGIVDLAKDVGEKTSILLVKANELSKLVSGELRAQLHAARAQCACADAALRACAALTSPCICEPHCQSALTASAESLATTVQRLILVAKPGMLDEDTKAQGEELKAQSLDLAKALDALRNAYGNESPSVDAGAVKNPQKLKFMMRLADAMKEFDEFEEDLNKPPAAPTPLVAALLEKTLALKMADYNAAVASLLIASSDRDNIDFPIAEEAIIKIQETLPGIVKEMKTLAASKDEATGQAMLDDVKRLCEGTRGVCASVDSANIGLLDIATAACAHTSAMLSGAQQLAAAAAAGGDALDAAGARTAERAKAFLTCALLTAACINNPSCRSSLLEAADALSSSSSELAKSCSSEQSPLADRIKDQQRDVEDELDKLRKACSGCKEHKRSAEEERQRLQFVKSAVAAKAGLLALEKELNKPFSGQSKDNKLVLIRQQQLSDAMARLNSAIATLTTATADPENPDYTVAEEAMATVTELMPLVILDTKVMASSKDDKTRDAVMTDLKLLCDATREIFESHQNPHQLRESAKKFGVASGKLVYVLNPRNKPDDANKVIKHANLACNTVRQLVKDCHKLSHTLYATDVAAEELRRSADKAIDDVDALLTATQLTAPSLRDSRCQAVLLSSLDALSHSAQHLAQQWAPIQAVDKQPLVKKLDAQHAELVQRLHDMRNECLRDYIDVAGPVKTIDPKQETKEQKRVRFADTVSATKSDLRQIEGVLSKPYTGTLPEGQALAFRQLQLSNGLARLNAALAALAVATTDLDNPDFAAADEAMNIIHETLPQVVKDTKTMAAVRDDVSGEVMLGNARALCLATSQICDQAEKDPKALRQFAKNFATASGKLIYAVNSRAKQSAAGQVMESTQAACKTASQLVKTSTRLTAQLAPADDVRRQVAASGGRTADAADALMTAAQLTSPCISDPHCQSTFSTSIESLSSSAKELSSHWLPLLQEPLLTAVIRQLEKENEQLTSELSHLKDFCHDSKKAENIVHKPMTKPKPLPKKPKDEEVMQKQFTAALEKATSGLRAAEEDIKRVYSSTLAAPKMHKDQVKGVHKALEKKIALSNVAASALLAYYATKPVDYATAAKTTSDLASLMPKIAQDAKVLSNTMSEKQKKRFLDDILAMFDAAKQVIDAAHNDGNNLHGVAVEYGNKSGALLYSVCTDFDPSHEKEVISRAKAIGECVSELTEGSSALMSTAPEVTDLLCARGKACVTAAGNLVYTAKLVAPSIQVEECREILTAACEALSGHVAALSSAWQPLEVDSRHKVLIEELNVKVAKVEGLLEELKNDLDSGKLVKMQPLELLAEDTPLRKLTAALIDSSVKKSTNPSLSPEQKRALVEYSRALTAASARLDRANAGCKREPHDLAKRRELEDAVQNLQVLALQGRPSAGNRRQYIVDLTEYVKELSQEADKLVSTSAHCSTQQKDIDRNCREIVEEAERIMNPSNHRASGADTSLDDIQEVDQFGRTTAGRVKTIASKIQELPDSKDKILLAAQSVNLEDSCNILRFASRSAIATTQSAALDEALDSLADLELKIDDMLDSGETQRRYVDEPVSYSARTRLLRAASAVSAQRALAPALARYGAELRARTDLTNTKDKKRLQDHLRKLTYLLRVLTVETSRRVATWQEAGGPEVASVMEQVIKEIEVGCSMNRPPRKQSSVLQNIDLNRLLLASDVIQIEGDRKHVEDKLQQTATKLSSMLSTVMSSCSKPDSLARSLSVTADTASELSAMARALKRYHDPVYNAKIEEAVRDVTFQTYSVLIASELVSQEPNDPTHRRRLLDACRALNDALNNLSRAAAPQRKMQRKCSELTRNLQLNQTLLQMAQPTCALPYAECLDALTTQQEVIHKLNSDQPMSKEEFSRTLGYISSAVCNSSELAAHCGYLMSLGERDQDAAKLGVVDVRHLNKLTESAQATCYRVLQFDVEQAKEEAVHLISQSQTVRDALLDAEKKSLHLKQELESAAHSLQKRTNELEETLTQTDKAKISAATSNLLESIQTVTVLSEHPSLVPAGGDLTEDQKQAQDHVLTAARELTNKTASLIRDVKNHSDRRGDDDEQMTWVTFNLKRKDVVKAFEDLLASVRENGQRAGILQVEQNEDEPPKSYVETQVELATKWLKRPNCKPEVKASGEEAVRKLIDVAEKMSTDMRESEKEDMCVLITETKDLLEECSKKCTPDKASQLVDKLKSLSKVIERGVITMVVEDFIEGEEPLRDLEVMVDSETDATKRKFILERKIAELLAQLGRVTRTARAVGHSGRHTQLHLHTCTEQANLLAPLLVKAAQERIESPDNTAAIEKYKSLLAQYAESLSKIRELCDQSVDPMEFVQTAGETMQRMREVSSQDNDPQKCVYTSSAITKLANRVIHVSMSSSVAQEDPALRSALTAAQQRLRASVASDWRDTTAEILRTTGEVEAVMGGEMIFQNQPTQSDQPIFAAARDLHSVVREWSARDNEIVAVAKKTAVLMAKLSAHMNNNAQHELVRTSRSLALSARALAALARRLAARCGDRTLRTNLLQVCDQIPTISGQLNMLATVKGSSLSSGNKEDQESLNMLVDNAQNLMLSIQQVVRVSAGASVKIAAQRGGLRMRWVRNTYY
ncbi:talin-2-like isoform X2 [Plodia interpunctella]|uniref:talin-2-like isoform X2 n=1 Tax=Plodia interpunctella TaxID=58824 RepID=UPI002367F46F|nr:talin-2-like isoform X2 [Plodia interpunctella]